MGRVLTGLRWWVLLAVLGGCFGRGKHELRDVQLAATQAALEARMDKSRKEIVDCEERIELLREHNQEQKQMIAKRDSDREALLSEKAALLSEEEGLRASVAELTVGLARLALFDEEASLRVETFHAVVTALKRAHIGASVDLRRGELVVVLPTDTMFGGSAEQMSKRAQSDLAQLAAALQSVPRLFLTVVAHTDTTPLESELVESALELTVHRAHTVAAALIAAGVSPIRVSASGRGAAQPYDPGNGEDAHAANRRIEIVIVPDYRSLPGTQQLEDLIRGVELRPESATPELSPSPPIP
jgi:chemotaxis protein MotB